MITMTAMSEEESSLISSDRLLPHNSPVVDNFESGEKGKTNERRESQEQKNSEYLEAVKRRSPIVVQLLKCEFA